MKKNERLSYMVLNCLQWNKLFYLDAHVYFDFQLGYLKNNIHILFNYTIYVQVLMLVSYIFYK